MSRQMRDPIEYLQRDVEARVAEVREQRRFEAAKAAMQALVSRPGMQDRPEIYASVAVRLADALLEELKK